MLRTASSPRRSLPGQVAAASPLLLLLLLACCAGACGGAPIAPQGLQPAQQLQLWNEIDDACSSFLSIDSQPQVIRLPQRPKVLGLQASNALEELCFVIMGMLPKPQEQDEKDNTKRFLFHYSKTQKLGNSNVVSSVVHPLLQLVPHLHERRMKRFRVDEEFQNPFASQSRGYFLFRPRNGRRSAAFI
ncbi:neuromedin-U isoform X1 [Trachypithecus francoisi]|uniref:neuromedin-U isoform X1 n=1 Tax=Trachypithecus francoisi TaxID=54180 RepID=UPI00141A67E4|nr:neuromedin-U isoform X1 [Trachypithecus francoisi]